MTEMKRQTTLSLEELKRMFENGHTRLGGKCFMVNEIGIMATEGNPEAEGYLCEILEKSDHEISRMTAYSYLTYTITTPTRKTAAFMKQFNGAKENTELINKVKRYIARRFN